MCLINPVRLEAESVVGYKVMKREDGYYLPVFYDAATTDKRKFNSGETYEAASVWYGFHTVPTIEDAKAFLHQLTTGEHNWAVYNYHVDNLVIVQVELSENLQQDTIDGHGMDYSKPFHRQIEGRKIKILKEVH